MQPIIRVQLPDVPDKCGDCGQASDMWPLAVYGGRLNVTCPYCFCIVAPVVAVRLDASETPANTASDGSDVRHGDTITVTYTGTVERVERDGRFGVKCPGGSYSYSNPAFGDDSYTIVARA